MSTFQALMLMLAFGS
ncbi:putative holin-like toxin [Bacillus atrophaeus]